LRRLLAPNSRRAADRPRRADQTRWW
jgi:hypothetical protein